MTQLDDLEEQLAALRAKVRAGPATRFHFSERGFHHDDGPAMESPTGGHQWSLHGDIVTADEVATAWLERQHPGTAEPVRETFIHLVQQWAYGDSMPDLYLAAQAANH